MLLNGKRIHILGISGTFMAGVALLAKQSGCIVTGHDRECYSPMKEQLLKHDIKVSLGYDDDLPTADLYIIGNTIKRGNPLLEKILIHGFAYCSGPEWLHREILQHKWVVAVAGTHGKTTTTSMLVWLLEKNGKKPSFLIGGIAENMGCSARLTDSDVFVIEADEYDTAYFDKRPKFMHYRPKTLILNNLEFDHADIYKNLNEIATQFHYLIKTVPADGVIIYPENDAEITNIFSKGCWSKQHTFGLKDNSSGWFYSSSDKYSQFSIGYGQRELGSVSWDCIGEYNASNAIAAVAAANHYGVAVHDAVCALNQFKGVKRRLEHKGTFAGVICYDDFGHHPSALSKVLSSLRCAAIPGAKIIALVELGSYTMRSGIMAAELKDALAKSDLAIIMLPEESSTDFNWQDWSMPLENISVAANMDDICERVVSNALPGDTVISFSSSSFNKVHTQLRQSFLQAN
ncbi:MAG: UDP-N-acetylmuramate:L-alanyl-gamma-D-glutamyl-meso-diaminopimelate ligase [Legionellales bacterium]|nr:UDP-N-acetylmuramate:L-alanyl-gamma-D-glutamyl-meso-diaminopimelate ligase [Legionellales bacterium]